MKTFTKLIFAFALISLSSCTSQAKKTHEVFEYKNADYRMLSESLEDLKIAIDEGSTQEQYKAVVALRHISKHIDDAGKQALAVRGLAYLTAFGDDNQVTKRAESRLDNLFFHGSSHLQIAVIDAHRDLAIGDLGLTKKDTSLFNDSMELEYFLADSGEREDAVAFLVDRFEDADEIAQYHMAGAFATILANDKRCLEWESADAAKAKETKPDASADASADTAKATPKKKRSVTASGFTCDEWDSGDQHEIKVDLMEDIEDLLEDTTLKPEIATRLIMAVSAADHLRAPDFKTKALDQMGENMFINDERKLLIDAALNNSKSYYPDIFTANFKKKAETIRSKEKTNKWTNINPTLMANMLEQDRKILEKAEVKIKITSSSFTRKTDLKSLTRYNQRNFWINNAEPILENQLFNPSAGRTKQVPVGWLFFPGYDDSPESLEQKEILYFYSLRALKKGYIVTGTKSYASMLKSSLDQLDLVSRPEATRRLQLIASSFPSLKANGEKVKSLLSELARGAKDSNDLYTKRLHLVALASAVPVFKSEAEPLVCEAFKDFDIYSTHLAKNRIRGQKGYANPYLTLEGKINTKAVATTVSPKLCDQPLYFHPTEPVAMMMPEVEEEEAPAEETTDEATKEDAVDTTETPKTP